MSVRGTVASVAGRARHAVTRCPVCIVCDERIAPDQERVESAAGTAHQTCISALQRGARSLRKRGGSR